jgi:arylsulfatase A-like enzyme
MLRAVRFLAVAVLLHCFGNAAIARPQGEAEVKLVLQITIDGLRADRLSRYGDRFGEGGFRYLLEKGAVYTNAHYQHANTETIVGHTILATGAFPSESGMIGNVWYDRETGELAYNIEDPQAPILPTREVAVKGEQVDPAQKKSRTQGRSPRAILAATFSDTLATFNAGRSKIFGVSGKDRGAVSMAGHTGKAFWYSTDSGDFITSAYYYDAYPEWAREWNAARKAAGHAGSSWTLLNDPSTYVYADQDDRPYEVDLRGYGRVFPHPFGEADDGLFATKLLLSPVGDRLPSSLENEDVVLRLDRTLADLFAFIDEKVGLEHTLIVLAADHGMAEMPEYMTELGYEVGRLSPDGIVDAANEAGKRVFGIDGIVKFFFRPYVYLDDEKLVAAKVDKSEAEGAVAAAIVNVDGVAYAVPRRGLAALEYSPVLEQVRRNTHVSRSGDIYVAQEPYWFLFDKGPVAVMHGSPWRYDTHVPVIFAGPSIRAQRINRLVHPVDVAPTLSAFLGMTPPSSAAGSPLEEVLP